MINKVLKISFKFACILIVFIFYTNNYIINSSDKQIFEKVDSVSKNYEIGLVLGAKAYVNRLSDVYSHRLETAVDAYHSGKINKILVSGDNENEGYDEITPAVKFLISREVRKEDILTDPYGLDTYDSLFRAVTIYGANDILIFTQEFHQNRSVYICNSFNIKCAGVISDKDIYAHISDYKKREILARVKAIYNVTFNSNPKHLQN